MRQDKSHTI